MLKKDHASVSATPWPCLCALSRPRPLSYFFFFDSPPRCLYRYVSQIHISFFFLRPSLVPGPSSPLLAFSREMEYLLNQWSLIRHILSISSLMKTTRFLFILHGQWMLCKSGYIPAHSPFFRPQGVFSHSILPNHCLPFLLLTPSISMS